MTGIDLGLPLISRLIDAYPGVIVGTKDSSGDRERIMTLCREFPDFSVLAGTETLLLETLRGGGEGCISATVNVTSRLARRVHDAHASGKDDEAEALQERSHAATRVHRSVSCNTGTQAAHGQTDRRRGMAQPPSASLRAGRKTHEGPPLQGAPRRAALKGVKCIRPYRPAVRLRPTKLKCREAKIQSARVVPEMLSQNAGF